MSSYGLKNGKILEICKADAQDALEMLEYLKVVGSETDNLLFGAEGVPFTIEQEIAFLNSVSASPNNVMLIGKVDNQIVSTCSCTAGQRERNRHVGIFGIAVRKCHWNTGVGSAMAKELIDWAMATGILTVLQLKVRIDNPNAIHLYESVGFRRVGILHRDFKVQGNFVDMLSMERLLN